MKQVITTERIPIKLWLGNIEEGALNQAKNLANLPFAYRHIAIIANSHKGYGMSIGGVLATENTIIPNAGGVDIRRGTCSLRTDCKKLKTDNRKQIISKILK